MVESRTTTDYIKTNLEIYGSHLNRYLDELRDGGKSESAIRSIRSKIRSFLMRCPPTSPDGLTANIMMKVKKEMESDNLSEASIRGSMIHTGRFIEFITGSNPYTEIDPESKQDWFTGHMGVFLFERELEEHISHLKGTGVSVPYSIRKKAMHITICCRILTKEKEIFRIDRIDCDCLKHIKNLTNGLVESTSKKIIFDLSEFVEYHTGTNLLNALKETESENIFTFNDETREFMRLVELYRLDQMERGFRPRSVQSIIYSIKEGYQELMKEFGPIHPRDINYHHIRRLRNTITNLKQRTIRTYLNRLGKMLEFFYGVNPYRQADVLWSPEATERDWIFKAQWKELWNRADETERLTLALGGGMGLRRSEIADIKISDISGNVLSVHGKGSGPNGKVVTMRIPPTVMRCIDDYLVVRSSIIGEEDISDGNLLVMSRKRKGSSATSRSVETILQHLSEKAGIHVTCHMLRRFYCMAMVDAGLDIDTVRRMMRHEHITTTIDCYVCADPRKMAQATDTIEDVIF